MGGDNVKSCFWLLLELLLTNMCPVCTVTVGAALGISRLLGVDDTVTGVWIGGLILSLSFVTINWLMARFPKLDRIITSIVVIILMYTLTLIPLYYTKFIGLPHNTFWGIDKIVFSVGIGSVVFLKGVYLDKLLRKKYEKQFIQFQKVILPVAMLTIASVIFFFLTK